MKASVERIRWFVAGAAVLLLLVLGVFLGYGRYRALRSWQRIMARSGLHITHETDGYTFSQSVKGRTTFMLHAAKAIQLGDGKWSLQDAVLTLYAKTGNSVDHVYGKEFEYDEKTGVARALGEVLMDVQPPVSSGTPPLPGNTTPDRMIHVRTSGLVYVRKLAVAATDQEVEFRYGDMECFSKGAEFDTGENILRLLDDVRMKGELHGAAVTLNAAKADLNRQTDTIALVQPVASRQGQTARATAAIVALRNDGSIASAQADGAVTLDAGTRHLVAAHMEGTFQKNSQPEYTRLSGGVTLADSNATRPLKGQAQQVETRYNAAGAPTSVLAEGSAGIAMTELRTGTAPLARTLRGDQILAKLIPVVKGTTSRLSEVHVTGYAIATGDSVGSAKGGSETRTTKSTQLSADDLDGVFDEGANRKPSLQQITGHGHTRMVQTAASGERQETAGDALSVAFAPASSGATALNIVSAVQTGAVRMHSVAAARSPGAAQVVSDASADKASFDALTDHVTLTGQAQFSQAGTTLRAASIAVEQHLGDVDAHGEVIATMQSSSPEPKNTTSAATHVTADHAHLAHASGLAEFFGSSGHPARLWQDASQVEAASLLFDQKKHSLTARPESAGGLVHATFASGSTATGSAANTKASTVGQVLHVTSAAMDYDDTAREAVFAGGVRMDGSTGIARSERGVVFLSPATNSKKLGTTALSAKASSSVPNTVAAQPTPFAGSLDRVVLTGGVHLDQPGRIGTGEELMYTASDSSYVLTGTAAKPAHIVDAQQGNVTGATLLFRKDDNTIIVAGAPSVAGKHGRVRSETEVSK